MMDVALQVARISAFGVGVVYSSVKLGILKVEDSARVGRFVQRSYLEAITGGHNMTRNWPKIGNYKMNI